MQSVEQVRRRLDSHDYERLLVFRTDLRRYLRYMAEQAGRAGLTPTQHQLLLAVRGHSDDRGPTIGEIADYMTLRHHSAVELVSRAQKAGLVRRTPDPYDRRVVRVSLTGDGARRVEKLTRRSLEELERIGPGLRELLQSLGADGRRTEPRRHRQGRR